MGAESLYQHQGQPDPQQLTEAGVMFDLAIIGGGLAGLTLAIQMKRLGHTVILFEKENYPFHRVCGEYISLESAQFLLDMGIDMAKLRLPVIDSLEVSAPNGNLLTHKLSLGGIGISRQLLDFSLANIAKYEGVEIHENDKVQDVIFTDAEFTIIAGSGNYKVKAAAGCFGKRSNMDIKWGRHFVKDKPNKLNHYIGVKYHIKSDYPANTIALHNFKDGYCGISKIEEDRYCLCYLTTAANLKSSNNSIKKMEQKILCKNPLLAKIFQSSEFVFEEPLVISQISFEKKSTIENHVLMIGDAAGMITPLCGNGMSMAMHAGKIAANLLHQFLKGRIGRDEMEKKYIHQWHHAFSTRLRMGRWIQSFFGGRFTTNLFIRAMKTFPSMVNQLEKRTHGDSF